MSRAVSVLASKHSDIVRGLVPVGNNQVCTWQNLDTTFTFRATWTTWRGIMHGAEQLEGQGLRLPPWREPWWSSDPIFWLPREDVNCEVLEIYIYSGPNINFN